MKLPVTIAPHDRRISVIKLITRLCLVVGYSGIFIPGNGQSLNEKIRSALDEEGLTGAVWSVVQKDSIALGAAGLSHVATGQPMNTESRVHIGSVTKTLIATGILRMVTKGEIRLDTEVQDILKDLYLENPWHNTHPITVRHLLDHTSGLEDARLWQIFSLKPQPKSDLLEAFTRDPDILKIRTRPGSQFSYSNMGYTMLGLIIEQISGQAYEEYLDTELLQPLGMTASTFRFIDQETDPGLAMGHFEGGQTQSAVPSYLRPAMQFTTTARDMALFAKFLMSDGAIGEQSFIDEPLLRQMGHAESTIAARRGLKTGYSLGLSYRDRYGVLGYYHSGNTVGYRATLYLFPEEQKAFFISFNADSETADYRRFIETFIRHMDLPKPQAVGEDMSLPDEVREWEGYYRMSPVRFEMFGYLDYLFGFLKLQVEENGLVMNPFQANPVQLYPVGNDLFRASDRNLPSHVRYKEGGTHFLSNGLTTYKKTSGFLLLLHWISLITGVAALIYILVRSVILLIGRNFGTRHPLFLSCISMISLLAPIPLFMNQSFLALGDLTLASISLVIVTGLLPISLTIGLLKTAFGKANPAKLDIMALLFALQWMIVLFAWDMIPFMLWV